MLSNKSYLLRAFHQWIVDSQCTPILVIDANHPRCKIPLHYVEGGEIVFNISSTAVRDLKLTNELVEFKASFSGVIHIISVPVNAVLAVYAEENGEGIFFDGDEEGSSDASFGTQEARIPFVGKEQNGSDESTLSSSVDSAAALAKGKPFLKLVE